MGRFFSDGAVHGLIPNGAFTVLSVQVARGMLAGLR